MVRDVVGQKAVVESLEHKEKFFEIAIEPEWYLFPGDIVHSPPKFGSVPIAHSDTLVSCTGIATAAICPRHAVLADRYRDADLGVGGKNMLLGNFLHEVFQDLLREAVAKRQITGELVRQAMMTQLEDNVASIIRCNESIKTMELAAREYYVVITRLINDIVHRGHAINLNFTQEENENRTRTEKDVIKVEKVLDIEENLWEPKLGLKGKIDVTAQVRRKDGSRLVMPIELKSGKGNALSMQHRIQTQLYGMAQAARGGETFHQKTSIVAYIKTAKTFSIPIKRAEIDQILERRNTLAGFYRRPLRKRTEMETEAKIRELPPLLENNPRECEFCYKRDICAFWAKEEGLTHEDPTVQGLFDQSVKEVTPTLADYVKKWTTLALLEQKHANKKERGNEVWNPECTSPTVEGILPYGKVEKHGGQWHMMCKLPVSV